MVNLHPKEDRSVEGYKMTWLAYFAARCPIAYPAEYHKDGSVEFIMRKDCEARVEWARAMLHALWPVAAQNSQNSWPTQ
jgi:hypothetical protein